MEIRQSFVVEQPLKTVWAALGDIRLVASCVPGAEIVSISDDGREIEGRIRTKIGPLSAAFSGVGKIERDDVNYTGTVEGAGADKNSSSRIKINLDYAAKPSADQKSTTTEVVAKVVLTGPLAQFGKGALINDIAAAMTAEFTRNLKAVIDPPAPQSNSETSVEMPRPSSPAAAELRPMTLLWMIIKARICGLFRKAS